jgi:hypothetical protein
MAARLEKESIIETSEKFLRRKMERIASIRHDLQAKESDLIKPPDISESSRFLAIKRAEELERAGIIRPATSPGLRLYALAQYSHRKKQAAIQAKEREEQSAFVKSRPQNELLDLSRRLFLEAETRRKRILDSNDVCDSGKPPHRQVSPESTSTTLVSPYCQDLDSVLHRARAASLYLQSHRSSDACPTKIAQVEEDACLVSDMSRLLAEKREIRTGISSHQRLHMPLEKDRDSSQAIPFAHSPCGKDEQPLHNGDSRFDKWREQKLQWHAVKQQMLEEFRAQQHHEYVQNMQSFQIKSAREIPEDLFFRKQLDRKMRQEQILQRAREEKDKQEQAMLMPQKTKPITASTKDSQSLNRLLKNTAAQEARAAARFKGDT